jgi:PST family polysaccharide transporter
LRPDALALLAWQFANYAVPLALLPFFSRTLNVEGLGVYGLVIAVTNFAMTVTDWGFVYTSQRALLDCAGDPARERRVIWETIAGRMMLAGASALIIFAAAALLGPDSRFSGPLLVGTIALIGGVFSMEWFLRGREKFARFALAFVVGRGASLPLAFLLVQEPDDAVWAVLAIAFGIAASGFLSFALSWPLGVGTAHFPFRAGMKRIRESVFLFIPVAATNAYMIATPVIITGVSTVAEAGLFAGADRIKSAARVLFFPITMIAFPRINSLRSTDPEALKRYVPRLVVLMLVCYGVVCGGLVVAAPWIAPLFLGQDFAAATPVLQVLAAGAFVSGLSHFFGTTILVSFGMNNAFLRTHLVGVGVGVPATLVLAAQFGAVGAACGALLGECLTLGLQVLAVRRHLPWALAFKR